MRCISIKEKRIAWSEWINLGPVAIVNRAFQHVNRFNPAMLETAEKALRDAGQ